MSGDAHSPGSAGHDPVPSDPQDAADRDQTASESDQTMADRDQTAADVDQAASERDQLAADRDQEYADLDQAARAGGSDDEAYARSRRGRSESSLARDLATEARTESARMRESDADQRDAVADWRDGDADLRDQVDAQLDADGAVPDERRANGSVVDLDHLRNAARDREQIAGLRARAAAQREAAARDRREAAEDRRQAGVDREVAAREIARQGIDQLTGTLRRQAGRAAIQREMDRTARSKDRLVAAFIDVDGLKSVNDALGHTAGDELLQAVARCAKDQLRSYDLIARYGGDEFVCTISGHEMTGVRDRFTAIEGQLSDSLPGATISVGFAEREPGESLDHLIDRADAMLRSSKQSRRR